MNVFVMRKVFLFLVIITVACAVSADRASAGQRALTDDAITDYVRMKLTADPIIKGGALSVDCKLGVVTLRGNVKTEKQKQRAEKITKKVKGVKQVVNQLAIQV